MYASMRQAGAELLVECRHAPWLERLVSEACGEVLRPAVDTDPDVHVVISDDAEAFDLSGWQPLTRGAYHRDGDVVLLNSCGSGFDLRVTVVPYLPYAKIRVDARYRPPHRERVAAAVLRSRFHLLARAVLLQYPALWVAGTRARMPLHASAVTTGSGTALLVGPGGVGRSSLLLGALAAGGSACSDNLCVSDGAVVHGLVEPIRIEGGGGRRMPHGRAEQALPGRVDSLVPDHVVVVSRVASGPPRTRPISPARAARVLAAGTFMAGELRRYWSFAATLSLGTGRGPAYPQLEAVAAALTRLPCVEVVLGAPPAPVLADLLAAPVGIAS